MEKHKYNLKMNGLKKACGDTKDIEYFEGYCEIFYDLETGDVWTSYQHNMNSWTEYNDPNVIKVANVKSYKKMDEIADMIEETVEMRKTYCDVE